MKEVVLNSKQLFKYVAPVPYVVVPKTRLGRFMRFIYRAL